MALDPAKRYSHPPEDGDGGTLLLDHLRDVALRVDHVVPADATTPSGESLREVVRRLALVHDFGKATTWFQQYIDDDRRDPTPERKRYHAPLGSFAAYAVLDGDEFADETRLAGFVAVAKHHGRLPDVTDYVYKRTTGDLADDADRLDALVHQAKDIYDDAPDVATTVFEDATGSEDEWAAFARSLVNDDSLLEEIAEHVSTDGQELTDALSPSCYGLVLQCWSALVLADKTSAAGADRGEETYGAESPDLETLNGHIDGLQAAANPDPDGTREQRLNYCRARAREAVVENAASFAEDGGGGVATLTLPTGMGKTLTGLSAAFTIRDALDGDRVVYALPFTSVIDQVVDDVRDIYDADLAGPLLTAHHHLENAAIEYDGADDAADGDNAADRAERDGDVAKMLGEAWRAGLTVSTFVQLFESLAGPRNRQSMKLPALQNAVVILDEPQSLPLDWWKLAPRLAELLVDQYDATVIAMTATQPLLFRDSVESGGDVPELVDVDDYDYFDAVERVTYEFDDSAERYIESRAEPNSYADAAAELRALSDESALAVTNTIDSARELTDAVTDDGGFVDVADAYADELDAVGDADAVEVGEVAKRVLDDGRRPVLHLSTRLRPVDRLTLVETAKQLTEKDCGLLVVSTQLIEAGVDISFDRVYRDFAPLDSIVQAAGRCNRSFERDRGTVTVWWLDAPNDDSQKTPAEAVYNTGGDGGGTKLLPVTAKAVEQTRSRVESFDETAMAKTAVERFYRILHDVRDVGTQAYADYVDDADADALGDCSLIDQKPTADVLVTRTPAERRRVEALREANRTFDFDALDRLRAETKPIRLSIPLYDDETKDAILDLPPVIEDEGLYALDTHQYRDHFNTSTGFTVPESTVAHQFL
ncbi:CRISPR-associated endonuclease Cas3'' [Halocalculus aciditolerans]|uniref:CRISPR-associated helicase/endonuclease Cas3 n=1 Tax=Halocalculus aciditolerans TaxID=1383812 RepID=A0A830F349_9EURY|nr:CRISPR-associated endonuclease Cas3'' [Halocalculus aciditolerans]GGL58115.1 CRISPR-associated helicase/endonuclease Cas3 [Halocalculus aciditolerans]